MGAGNRVSHKERKSRKGAHGEQVPGTQRRQAVGLTGLGDAYPLEMWGRRAAAGADPVGGRGR